MKGAIFRLLASCATGVGLLALAANACEPQVVVGARFCAEPPGTGPADAGDAGDGGDGGGGVQPDPDAAVITPWQTGFEDGFCDYGQPLGFCYATGASSYSLVTSPVHQGRYAAAFSVRSDVDGGSQVRCVQQGVFPKIAYYGAWYYVPGTSPPTQNTGTWNLLHFQGGPPGGHLDYLWDVSIISLNDGGLHSTLFDFLSGSAPDAAAVPPIPTDRWFHLEVYFNRAKDMTGEIALFQDGKEASRLRNLVTDTSDWGQWYVGNLATALTPPASTIYVDDVTITATP